MYKLAISLPGATLLLLTGCKEVEGSGDVDVNVSKKLGISIAGSGDIRVKGDPEINSTIMGSGDIVHVNSHGAARI